MPDRKREHIDLEIPSKAVRIKHASCLKGHSLMDSEHKINGYPSVKVKAKYKDEEGIIFLDPIYGSFKNIHGIKVPKKEIVQFFCPECGISLTIEGRSCNECSAPMFSVFLPKGGMVEACLRDGCHYHTLRLIDSNDLLKKLDEEETLDSYL